jgi:hypothetical protein
MRAILSLFGTFVGNLFKSRRRPKIENLFLRHQLNIALRRAPRCLRLRGCDRALLVWMTRRWPSLLGLARVVQPGTILRWHRAGFRAYWRWKSRGRPGRPCGDRSVSGSNPDIPVLVCVSGRGPRSTPATVVCSEPAGDGGVARATDRGSISVGHRADLFGARQRWCLRAGLHKANSSDGDSGPPDFTEIALAKPIC